MISSETLTKFRSELLSGKVVVMPTETVYGLACINKDALSIAKGRPEGMPIAQVFWDKEALLKLTDSVFVKMAIDRLLPGPFTLLIKTREIIIEPILPSPFTLLINARETVGVRLPEDFTELIHGIDVPIYLTSANPHKAPPALTFEAAQAYFPEFFGVDGGPCKYAKPSMIIDLTKER